MRALKFLILCAFITLNAQAVDPTALQFTFQQEGLSRPLLTASTAVTAGKPFKLEYTHEGKNIRLEGEWGSSPQMLKVAYELTQGSSTNKGNTQVALKPGEKVLVFKSLGKVPLQIMVSRE